MEHARERRIERHYKVDVSEWTEPRRFSVFEPNKAPILLLPNIIAMLLTLLVHGMIMTAIAYVSVGHQDVKHGIEISGAELQADSSEALTLLVLSSVSETPGILVTPALTKLNVMPLVQIDVPKFVKMEPSESPSGEATPTSSAAGIVATEREWLHSIYIRQIQARIERVWRRPRTPVKEIGMLGRLRYKDEAFQCELLVTQDPTGNVEDIELNRCNGSGAWQQSLIDAIRSASPLPAPPNANIFSTSIALTFVGRSYAPGIAEDEYEPQPRQYVSVE